MKLEYTDGCICTSLTVDGKKIVDMSKEELKEVICKLLDRESDLGILQDIWRNLVTSQGEFEDLGHCEECGDYITRYTLEI